MLAEKFCLLLETLKDQRLEYRVESTSPHVPIVPDAGRATQEKKFLSHQGLPAIFKAPSLDR